MPQPFFLRYLRSFGATFVPASWVILQCFSANYRSSFSSGSVANQSLYAHLSIKGNVSRSRRVSLFLRALVLVFYEVYYYGWPVQLRRIAVMFLGRKVKWSTWIVKEHVKEDRDDPPLQRCHYHIGLQQRYLADRVLRKELLCFLNFFYMVCWVF